MMAAFPAHDIANRQNFEGSYESLVLLP